MSTTIFLIFSAVLNTVAPTKSFGYIDYQYYDKQNHDSINYKKDLYEFNIQHWLNDVI